MKLDLGKIAPRNRNKKSANGSKRSRRSSQTLTFILFLGLAFFFWIMQRMQGEIIRTLYVPLRTDSLNVSSYATDSLPRFIELEVQDKGFEHIRYALSKLSPISLNVYKDVSGVSLVGIDRKELSLALAHRLSPSAVIIRQSFADLSIELRPRSSKRVPLRLASVPYAGTGYTTSLVEISPDSLVVYGERARLDTLSAVVLPNIYDGLTESYTDMASVRLDKGLYTQLKKVRVGVVVEELTEQSFTLPIVVSGVPEGYTLLPLPSVATVLLTIPRSKYGELTASDIELTAQYAPADDWERSRGVSDRTLGIRLEHAPDWVKRYSIKPERIQFVLEH